MRLRFLFMVIFGLSLAACIEAGPSEPSGSSSGATSSGSGSSGTSSSGTSSSGTSSSGTSSSGTSSSGASSSGASSSGASSSGASSSGTSSSGASSSGTSSSGTSSSGTSSSGTSSSGSGGGTTVHVNAGGDEVGAFLADAYHSGGSAFSTTHPIDTSLLGEAVPASVFQTERYGEFTYTIPGRTPNTAQTVSLYLAESRWSAAGQRTFDVRINGTTALRAFDIFAAAGGADRAVARTFSTTADAAGRVVIAFERTGLDSPKVCAIAVAGDGALPRPDEPPSVSSPNGRVRAELSTTGGVLRYRVTVDGKQVVAPSELGIRSDGVEIGQNAVLGPFTTRSVDERYPLLGARPFAVNRANEASVPVTSGAESYHVDVHVADDGVGVRLRLAARRGRKIEADRSSWRLDGNPTVWVAEHDAGYEQHYRARTLDALGSASYGMPLTAKVGGLHVSITEAAVKDYGDLALRAGAGGLLQGHLYADQGGWTTDAAVVQPWRVTIVAGDLAALVDSTLVQNLNPPRDASLDGAGWITPGRSSWQWMAIGAPQLSDQQQWVDWTRQLGFEYYLVDEGWSAWPNAWGALQSLVTYATSKGVRLWLWVHSNEVMSASARQAFFARASELGIAGIKIDFPPACSRSVSNWYWESARDAARYRLLLDFHGAAKPTGIERTWPNVLTREAVRGHEYHMTRYGRVLEPGHDTLLPFTRQVAGAADYTPTVFAKSELQGNTWAHELAQPIAFPSPFLCYGGHPRDYLANAAVDVLRAIPAVWDESIVLPGTEPGKVAGFARRSGSSWFVGILNGASATTLDLPLAFLGSGTWQSVRLGDVPGRADAWDRQEGLVSPSDVIAVKLSSRGGFVAWFRQ